MAEHPQDEALVAKARSGDDGAFEELFNRYKKPIYTFIYRFIGNRETAKEVSQEVFVYVYKNLDAFDPKKKFVSWIFMIARSLAKNALRDRKYSRHISLEAVLCEDEKVIKLKDALIDPAATPDMVVDNEELKEAAQKVLNAMPAKYKEVITLCSAKGLTEKEAAHILGCTIAAVSQRLKKAKLLFIRKLGLDAKGV
jgi:RNA polymerase sigma-70 factor (ECF subfamily)